MARKVGKTLVVGVIVLFLGVGIQPAFADASIKSDNSEPVEITVHYCKEDGIENHIKYVTQQQADELEALFDKFNKKLDKANTIEETAKIHNELTESLVEIGLLLEDINIKKRQDMIVNRISTLNRIKGLGNVHSNNKTEQYSSDESNFLCLISGKTTRSILISPMAYFISRIGSSFGFPLSLLEFLRDYGIPGLPLYNAKILIKLFDILTTIFHYNLPTKINQIMQNREIHFGSHIGIGGKRRRDGQPLWAEGSINSFGLNGIKNWAGKMLGRADTRDSGYITDPEKILMYRVGVKGFIGYGFQLPVNLHYYGAALKTRVLIL